MGLADYYVYSTCLVFLNSIHEAYTKNAKLLKELCTKDFGRIQKD